MQIRDMYHVLQALAIANVRSYESPYPFNSTKVGALRTSDYVQDFHPVQSLPDPYNKPVPAVEHKKALDFLAPVIANLTCDIQEIFVDTTKLSAVTRLTAHYDFKAFGNESAVNNYECEYEWTTVMDQTSGKIKRVEEFMDVQRVIGFFLPKAQRYQDYLKSHPGSS